MVEIGETKVTYQEVLQSVGYPEQVLVIDFETYYDSDYALSKMSTIEFIMDPRFEFTGVGVWHDEEIEFCPRSSNNYVVIYDYIASLQNRFGQNLEHVTVVAKNCKFDMTILAVKFGIIPPYIIDIDDLLRHYDARMKHAMKHVTKMFGLKSKGDTSQFKGLHYEDMDIGSKNNLVEYSNNDIEIEVDLFKKLLPLLSNPKVEIPVARHTLDLYLRPKIKFDFKKATSLKIKMLIELGQIAGRTGHTKEELSGNLSFVGLLQSSLPEGEVIPVKAGKPGKNMTKLLGKPGVIPGFAKDDLGFQELLIHPDKTVRELCLARQAIKSWPLHIKRINNMEAQAKVSGGLLRIPLHYYGGHTGRWSGGEKINPQNLGGRGRGGQGTHPLISAMRSLLGTPDDSILGIADSAQIEARILAWLADQEDLTKGFADGEDVYSVFATELFKSPVRKATEDDSPEVKHELEIRRGFGKDSILGCGFGEGPTTFYLKCIANKGLYSLFKEPTVLNEKKLRKIMQQHTKALKKCGVENYTTPKAGEYDEMFVAYLILRYRTVYSQIPKFWKDTEKAFKWVIKYPHQQAQVSRVYDDGDNAAGFRLTFFNREGTVHLRLPSGRELTYRHCAMKQTTKGSEIRWHYGHLWGGSIVENIVQAVARDLLAYWILEIDSEGGLPIVLHSHDEIVCMLKNNEFTEGALRTMIYKMCQGPEWANGLPLDAEGELSKVYKK